MDLKSELNQSRRHCRPHPSNVLYNGEAHDFEHAMNLVVGECDRESAIVDPEYQDKLVSSLDKFKQAAQRCRTEYTLSVRAAEAELALKWIESGDPDMKLIGEALRSRDYSILAI